PTAPASVVSESFPTALASSSSSTTLASLSSDLSKGKDEITDSEEQEKEDDPSEGKDEITDSEDESEKEDDVLQFDDTSELEFLFMHGWTWLPNAFEGLLSVVHTTDPNCFMGEFGCGVLVFTRWNDE